MKRIIIGLMVTVLFTTSFTNVFASNLEKFNCPENIVLQQDEYGNYEKATDESKSIKAVQTEDEGIYRTETGDLVRAYGDTYVPVEKAQANLKDIDKLKEIITKLDLPIEVEEDILSDSQRAIDSNNNSSEALIIAPKKIIKTIPNVQMSGIAANSEVVNTSNYTHDGFYLKDITYSVTNIDTPTEQVENGYGVNEFIADASTLALVGAGFANVPVAIVGAGLTILELIESRLHINAVDIDYSPSNFVEMNLTYDRTRKYTYVSVTGLQDDFYIGAKTLYLSIKNVYTKTFTVVNGNGESTIENNSTVQVKKSENYDDPAEKAIQFYVFGYWDETDCQCEVGDITFYFN